MENVQYDTDKTTLKLFTILRFVLTFAFQNFNINSNFFYEKIFNLYLYGT